MEYINYMQPSYGQDEIDAVTVYMNSGAWLTEFQKTREFERLIVEYTGSSHCSVMVNGTMTLISALMACGIAPGDEVIVPDFTMSATAHVIEILGAKAVFVDIERDTLCIDFDLMKNAVTSKTKAVMMVDLNGRYPSKTEEIVTFCKKQQLWLIEDAAQALGSTCKGVFLGTIGDIGSFSFSMPKIITTGQGGAVITANNELYEKMLRNRDFGRETTGSDHYISIGANFKFTDLQAVIGIEQMKRMPDRVKIKREICKKYDVSLEGIKEITLFNNNYSETAPCFYEILCERRAELVTFLKNRNIGTREFYPPLHSEPAYGYNNLSFPVTEEIASKGLWLPSSVLVTDEQIKYIADSIKEFYQ